MKKTTTYTCLLLLLLATAALSPSPLRAQAAEIRQLLLNVEKLQQLRNILTDMKEGYTILHTGYGAIRDISQGSFTLHETFLDGLLAVNPSLQQYSRVAAILSCQQDILREYREASRRFGQSGSFTPGELAYLRQVYGQLSDQSLRHLEELTLVLTAGKLRMDDAERLEMIDRIYLESRDKLNFLRHFNRQAAILALQREQEQTSLRAIQRLYQLPAPRDSK